MTSKYRVECRYHFCAQSPLLTKPDALKVGQRFCFLLNAPPCLLKTVAMHATRR